MYCFLIELFVSDATNSLMAKIVTNGLARSWSVYRIWKDRWILTFMVSKWQNWSPDIIGSFSSDAKVSLVAKMEIQKIPLLWINSSPVDRFLCLGGLNNHIDLPNMIGSFASGANASKVAKIGTKYLSTFAQSIEYWIMDGFWCLSCLYELLISLT